MWRGLKKIRSVIFYYASEQQDNSCMLNIQESENIYSYKIVRTRAINGFCSFSARNLGVLSVSGWMRYASHAQVFKPKL